MREKGNNYCYLLLYAEIYMYILPIKFKQKGICKKRAGKKYIFSFLSLVLIEKGFSWKSAPIFVREIINSSANEKIENQERMREAFIDTI